MRDIETNERHANDPQPGDYWHEMLCPIAVVLEVVGDTVVFCRNRIASGQCWRWDHGKTERLPKSEFGKLFRYETMPHKFYADVVPKGHVADVRAYQSAQR